MSRCDNWQTPYLANTAVTASQTVIGGWLFLDGAAGFSVQIQAMNGAAGTVYIDATNYHGAATTTFVTPTNQPVAANGTTFLSFGPADQATVFAQMRVRFVSSAAGNIQIATVIRRYTH